MGLEGKTAVITGGGSGIGQAIAYALAADGCRVAIAGRNQAKLETAAAASPPPHAPLAFHCVDVADRASVVDLFAWAKTQLGPIHILVNAAGVNIRQRGMSEMQPHQWDQLMAINATGAYNCMHAVLPRDAPAPRRVDRQYLVHLRQTGIGAGRHRLLRRQSSP